MLQIPPQSRGKLYVYNLCDKSIGQIGACNVIASIHFHFALLPQRPYRRFKSDHRHVFNSIATQLVAAMVCVRQVTSEWSSRLSPRVRVCGRHSLSEQASPVKICPRRGGHFESPIQKIQTIRIIN